MKRFNLLILASGVMVSLLYLMTSNIIAALVGGVCIAYGGVKRLEEEGIKK
jgi:hypothetical protein